MTRRGGRARRQRGASIPDWVWGLGLGLVVVVAVGGYFVLTSGGGSATTCDRGLNPLGASEISQNAFDEEDAALGRVIGFLNAGDRAGAETAFFGPVHNFTHNVDSPIRAEDENLAKELCEVIVVVEEGFPQNEPLPLLAQGLEQARELLRDGAAALGYDRPS
jgi:hypothetical protein